MKTNAMLFSLTLVLGLAGLGFAQDDSPTAPPSSEPAAKEKEQSTIEKVEDAASKMASQTEEKLEELAKTVDKDPVAQKTAAGILQPIYQVAEFLAFPAFHWVAFALMSAGVFSFVLQLLLGKLIVLLRMGFSFKEIASDVVGLAISVVGLVLTTQAAAENSSFTQSPAAVISATIVGGIVGIILYFWGQAQELQAAAGRSIPQQRVKK